MSLYYIQRIPLTDVWVFGWLIQCSAWSILSTCAYARIRFDMIYMSICLFLTTQSCSGMIQQFIRIYVHCTFLKLSKTRSFSYFKKGLTKVQNPSPIQTPIGQAWIHTRACPTRLHCRSCLTFYSNPDEMSFLNELAIIIYFSSFLESLK